jgi:hypothetical protein
VKLAPAFLCLCAVLGACGDGSRQNRVAEVLRLRSVALIEQRLSELLSSAEADRGDLRDELKQAGFRLVRDGNSCDSYSYDEDRDTREALEYTLSVRVDWCDAQTRVRAWYTGL